MQNSQRHDSPLLIPTLVLIFLFFLPTSASAAEDPIRPILQLANQVYRTSQDMVVHGSEGHVFEIISYGKKMLKRTETLLVKVESVDKHHFGKKKGKIIASIKEMIKKTKEAVELGEQNKVMKALTAARKASFRAKQTRQRLQMIR